MRINAKTWVMGTINCRILIITVLLSSTLFAGKLIHATIEWNETSHDFGKIPQNKEVTYEFIYKNPGMIPLLINKTESSCGCTVPKYTKEPVPPGGEGKVTVVFDAKSSGHFSKTITVHTNTQEKETKLYVKGEVIKTINNN